MSEKIKQLLSSKNIENVYQGLFLLESLIFSESDLCELFPALRKCSNAATLHEWMERCMDGPIDG